MHTLKTHKLLLAAAVVMFTGGAAMADGPLIRHAADFFKFDGTEFGTSLTAGGGVDDGALFYSKTVALPVGANVAYLTLYATGDEHGGAGLWLKCRYNVGPGYTLCRTGPGGIDTAPSGWIALHKVPVAVDGAANCNDGGGGAGDCHDNDIAYSWCIPLPSPTPARITFNLKMASSIKGQSVFIEKGHVYIDSSQITGTERCIPAGPPAATTAGEAVAATVKHQSK